MLIADNCRDHRWASLGWLTTGIELRPWVCLTPCSLELIIWGYQIKTICFNMAATHKGKKKKKKAPGSTFGICVCFIINYQRSIVGCHDKRQSTYGQKKIRYDFMSMDTSSFRMRHLVFPHGLIVELVPVTSHQGWTIMEKWFLPCYENN